MLTIPTPQLGVISAITMSSPDLEKSLAFYQKLGFKESARFDFPFPWIQVSDGALLIMLRKTADPYIALTYYVDEMDKVVSELVENRIEFMATPAAGDMIKRYLFLSPDGVNISLVTNTELFKKPEGPTMLTMPQADYFNPEKYPNPVCGMYGEFAQPVKDLAVSTAFWEKLGFSVLSKFEKPYPWAILSDGLSVIGLHQSTHFASPAITYFAADMAAKTEKLQAEGMEMKSFGGGGNMMLTTPEQQNIFLFSLGKF